MHQLVQHGHRGEVAHMYLRGLAWCEHTAEPRLPTVHGRQGLRRTQGHHQVVRQ